MQTGTRQRLDTLAGKRVVAAAGIADPETFARQLRGAGATVQLVAYQDHHPYGQADLQRLVRAADGGNYVVVTEKDAVKLREHWPGGAPEPLVAALAVRLERNGGALERALDAVLRGSPH
jgi:tetraacyldisaccharide-1-P 4'-kinase